jgi:hypothetical protein
MAQATPTQGSVRCGGWRFCVLGSTQASAFLNLLTPRQHAQDEGERKALVAELHRLKTDIFMDLVQGGTMPLRPGVQRLVRESLTQKQNRHSLVENGRPGS